jgi:hypothetical protein
MNAQTTSQVRDISAKHENALIQERRGWPGQARPCRKASHFLVVTKGLKIPAAF